MPLGAFFYYKETEMNNSINNTPIPVVFDTDMGADDWMAMLILLRSSNVAIKAVTVTGTGLANADAGAKHALNLLALSNRSKIPVAKGSSTPLKGNHAFPTSWREDTDNMLGLTLPSSQNLPTEESAVNTIISTLQESTEKVTILATGPLTNIASAFLKDSSITQKVKMIYVMGGAVFVSGNVEETYPQIKNSTAEWNIFIDPYAASVVVNSGVPVTLIPLDATNQVPVTFEFYNRLKEESKTTESEFFLKILTQQLDSIKSGQYYFWDPLAAALVINENFVTIKEVTVKVINSDDGESGRTIPDNENGSQIRVCISANSEEFERFILRTLNGN